MMNNLIKQFAIECAGQLEWDGPTPESYTFTPDEVARFANFIVNECLSNMENCDGDLDFAIWKTKQDFGV